MKNKILFSLLIVLLAIGLSGCKSPQEKATEKVIENAFEVSDQGKVDVDIDKGKQTIKFSDKEGGGSLQIDNNGNLDIPKEWPKEIKVYKKAKVISVLDNQGDLQFITQTNDNVDKIRQWYEKELVDNNWNKVTVMDMGDTWIGSYKKDKQQVNITITINEDGDGYIISHNYIR